MKQQHFEASYDQDHTGNGFYIMPLNANANDVNGYNGGFWVFVERNEQSQACINRIVDNLNKLAEMKAKGEE